MRAGLAFGGAWYYCGAMTFGAHKEYHVLGRDGGAFLCGSKDDVPSYKFLRQCKRCGSANQWVLHHGEFGHIPFFMDPPVIGPCTACDLLLLVEPKSVHCQQCEERGL